MRKLLIAAVIGATCILAFALTFGPRTPAVSGDDGYTSSAYGLDNSAGNLQFGNNGGVSMNTYVRFPNVTIPKGSTISSAKIQFRCSYASSGTTANMNIYVNDVDNASTPADNAAYNALAVTSAVAWNSIPAWGYWDSGADQLTSDFASIVEAVVGRSGWSSGNALMVLIKNNGSSADAYRVAASYDASGTPDPKPALSITYTEPASAVRRSLTLMGVGN